MKVITHKAAQVHGSIFRLSQDFYAIAGRQDQPLVNSRVLCQPLDGLMQLRIRNGQALTHFDRCGLMVHADELKLHD